MTTKQEAEARVVAAGKACDQVMAELRAADSVLSGSISVNGYGIFHDKFQVRAKLHEARKHIDEAMKLFEQVEFPTEADYDQL